jgi:hypothetical protein
MAPTRFTCTLTKADEPACQSYARVTIVDAEGTRARGCPRHVVAALNALVGAHVDWPDSRVSMSGNARPLSWLRNEANSDDRSELRRLREAETSYQSCGSWDVQGELSILPSVGTIGKLAML